MSRGNGIFDLCLGGFRNGCNDLTRCRIENFLFGALAWNELAIDQQLRIHSDLNSAPRRAWLGDKPAGSGAA